MIRKMVLSVVSSTVNAKMCTDRSKSLWVTSCKRPKRFGMNTVNWSTGSDRG